MSHQHPTIRAAIYELASQPGATLVYIVAGGLYQEGRQEGRPYMRQVARLDGLTENEADRLNKLAQAWHRRHPETETEAAERAWRPLLPKQQPPQ